MTIIRAPRPDRGFTTLSNAVLQDARLSMRALGLLVRLLSRPDHWTTNSEALSREFGTGRDQMRAVMQELSTAGYLRLVKERASNGQIASRWYVFDEPSTEGAAPAPEKPAPVTSGSGGPGALEKTDLEKTNTSPTPPGQGPKAGQGAPREEPEDHTPYDAILAAYGAELPMLPQPRMSTPGVLAKRRRRMRVVWEWLRKSRRDDGTPRAATTEDGIAWFHAFFATAREDDWLMGRSARSAEHKNWRPDFDFLLSDRGMKRLVEAA